MAAPRRIKAYHAQSGFVFSYISESNAPVTPNGGYRFWVSAGPNPDIPVTVTLDTAPWETAHRPLRAPERYGLAKFALHRSLDRADSGSPPHSVHAPPDWVAELAAELDLESL